MKKTILSVFLTLVLLCCLTSCNKDAKKVTINFSESNVTMTVGETKTIVPTVEVGKKVKNFELTYSIVGTAATVDQNGKVTAVSAGTVVLVATGNDSAATSASITITITAASVQTYTVVFDSQGGTAIQPQSITAGAQATKPAEPTKTGYTFNGWLLNGAAYNFAAPVNANITLVASWTENQVTPATYTVTFDANGGSNVAAQTVNQGAQATKPTDPTKAGYTFAGWTLNGTAYNFATPVNGNINLVASWTENQVTPTTYTVTFDVQGGSSVAAQTVTEGGVATEPTAPTKAGYTFDGWILNGQAYNFATPVNGNITLVASWEEEVTPVITFVVTFDSNGGSSVDSQTIEAGATVTKPADPTKAGYTFVGWYLDQTCTTEYDFSSPVNATITIYAKWESTVPGQYTISYYEGTTKLDLTPATYVTGNEIELPTPTKTGYIFAGWYLSNKSLTRYDVLDADTTGDVTLYAKYVATTVENPIVLPESTYKFTGVKTTNGAYQPVIPSTAPAASVLQYDWSTSDTSIATVSTYSSISMKQTGYVIITATYKSDPSITINGVYRVTSTGVLFSSVDEANSVSLCTVTFKDKEGDVIEEQTVANGGFVVAPEIPVYDGYAFTGWDKDLYNITADTVITATYTKGTNAYAGKSVAILGDSISTWEGYIPDGYDAFYPMPLADVTDMHQTWWMQTIDKLGASLFVNNSYSGTCVANDLRSGEDDRTSADKRLAHLVINGQTPDVIIIYMGSNDAAYDSVTVDAFDTEYKVMLDKIKALCPNSEIILCNLPTTGTYYSVAEKEAFNPTINKYAAEYGLKLIDFSTLDISQVLVDSGHPSTAGHTILANRVIESLLTLNTVTITYKDSTGDIISSEEVIVGSDATLPEAEKGYYYTWDKTETELTNVSTDLVVTGTLNECDKVVKYYIDGELVKTEELKYSATSIAPDFPSGTTNQKWVETEDVDGTTYYITYNLSYDLEGAYKISYYDGDTQLYLSPSSYEAGTIVTLPTPTKEGYAFEGWYLSNESFYRYTELDSNTDGNLELYARWVAKTRDYPTLTSTYALSDVVIVNNMYQPSLSAEASAVASSKTAWNWSSSDENIAKVSTYSTFSLGGTGYVTITATLKTDATVTASSVYKVTSDGVVLSSVEEASTVVLCDVTFADKEGDAITTLTVEAGGTVNAPIPPVYTGFAFDGWDKPLYNITENTTITATYVEGTNNYTGKKISILGDSISTYLGYIPTEYASFYPSANGDINNVNLTWWKQAINKLGAGVFTVNAYGGTCVSSSTNNSTCDDTRLSKLVVGGQTPDVIIIFMGTNDCGSQYVTHDAFDSSYKVMLDKIKVLCPNTEIILCTLPVTGSFYSETDRTTYNATITKYATEYSLEVIDFASVDVSGSLLDAVHPNAAGHVLLAEKVIEKLLG